MEINLSQVSYNGMGGKVREYRANMAAEQKDEVAQLKAARETLKEAHKTGDKDAIESARRAVADLEQKIHDNRDKLRTVHDDVAAVRTARQQLSADVKSGNKDAIQPDVDAFNEARDQVFVDLQA